MEMNNEARQGNIKPDITSTSPKHQPSSHFVFTCNLHVTSKSHMAMACMQSPFTMAPLFHRSMQRTHPVLLTWDTSMSFNSNSQQLSIPNFAPLSAIKCVYCTAQLKQRSLSIEFITGWNTDGVDG